MSIAPVWKIGALTLTNSPYLVPYGTDYGSPDASSEVLRSLLTDGDIELTDRAGNRTLTLPVLLEGSFSAMAAAEAALFLEVNKPINTLYCDPGDGAASPMKFTVNRGTMTLTRDDDYEQAGYRLYSLTWRALPWPQSTTKTTVSALAASGTTTTSINAFSSSTGVTGTFDGVAVTPSVIGGSVTIISPSPVSGQHTTTATIAGSFSTASTKLIFLDWNAGTGNEDPVLSATGDGVVLPKVASAPSPTTGYTRSWFYVAASSIVTSVTFTMVTGPSGQPSGTGVADVLRSLSMDQLSRTDVRPTLGSAKQQIRTLAVDGSAPTVGTIAIQHATTSLGDVLLYTCPDDGSAGTPACRPQRVSGNGPTSDANAVSGFYDTITSSPTVYDVPVGSTPEGEYLIVARFTDTNTGTGTKHTFNWSATPRMNNTDLASAITGSVGGVEVGGYTFLPLGMVHLPMMDQAPGTSSVTRLSVSATNTGAVAVRLDEIYLFNLVTGRLSQISCGTGAAASGGPSNRLWLDSPAPENGGLGRLLRGFAADRSDAFSAWASTASPTFHELAPGDNKIFTVATNPTTAVDVSYEYYKAGHSSV